MAQDSGLYFKPDVVEAKSPDIFDSIGNVYRSDLHGKLMAVLSAIDDFGTAMSYAPPETVAREVHKIHERLLSATVLCRFLIGETEKVSTASKERFAPLAQKLRNIRAAVFIYSSNVKNRKIRTADDLRMLMMALQDRTNQVREMQS